MSISAPRTMLLETLKSIILLDRPQKQILLELTISELSQSARKSLGKVLKSGTASDYTGYLPGSVSDNTTILGNLTYANFIHSLKAFAKRGEADIKARPSLMVLEGNEAIFNSSQNYLLPTPNGYSSAKLRFIDTGVILKITPFLGKDNEIILKISDSGSSNFSRPTNDVQAQKISTTIVVKPGESVLFGGMMQERKRLLLTKVPVLGDIPLIGYFFKSKEETKEIKEVIFSIRPQVVCRGHS